MVVWYDGIIPPRHRTKNRLGSGDASASVEKVSLAAASESETRWSCLPLPPATSRALRNMTGAIPRDGTEQDAGGSYGTKLIALKGPKGHTLRSKRARYV